MAQIPANMQTMLHNYKENGYQIIKSMINNLHAIRKNYMTYFRQAKNYAGQVKIIIYAPSMIS